MSGRRALEDVVGDLAASLANLESRVAALEGGPAAAPATAAPAAEPQAAAEGDASRADATRIFHLLGRSVLVLAGAFLLRFVTDSGAIPPLPGALAGLAYGTAVLLFADRDGGRGERTSARFHGLVAAVVTYPLIWEATASLRILPPASGALALGLFTGAGLFVAWRRDLRMLAWTSCLACLVVGVPLHFAGEARLISALVLLLLGVATSVLAYARRWHFKRWLAAAAVNLVVFRLVNQAVRCEEPPVVDAGAVQALALGMFGLYLGVFVWRALVQGRGAKVFDVCQTAAVLALGFGGALRIARTCGSGEAALGWTALVAAAAGYAVAFTAVRRRHGRGRGFFYFATLAMVLLVIGLRTMAHGPWLVWCWIILGLAMAFLGGRFDRVTLRAHSAFYMFLAAWSSGLSAATLDAMLAAPDHEWAGLNPSGVVGLIAAVVGYGVLALTQRDRGVSTARRLPRLALALIALMGIGFLAVTWPLMLLGQAAPAADPPTVAVVRTVVLSLTALALAYVGSRRRYRELGWIVWPVLVLSCAKLLFEDLRVGSPLALTLAFTALGGAMILAPRLLTRRGGRAA